MVKAVLASITNGGKVQRPWLGGDGQPVTSEMYRDLKLNRPMGVLVNSVRANGPAAQAGLKIGDVVIAVNGREIEDPEALRFRIATLPIGATAQISVLRNGEQKILTVKLVPPPDTPSRDTTELTQRTPLIGATVANMNPALAEELGMESAEASVIIVKLKPGTYAAQAGFQPGDQLLRINGKPVASVAALKEMLAQRLPAWTISIRRGEQTLEQQFRG
jgi:serine protease Do